MTPTIHINQLGVALIKHLNASNFFSTSPQQFFSTSPQQSTTFKTKNIPNNLTNNSLPKNIKQAMNYSFSLQNFTQTLNQNSSLSKIKLSKSKLQQAKSIFINELQFTHRKNNKLNSLTKDSNILKHQTLHLLQTKKHQIQSRQIQSKSLIQKDNFTKQSLQNIKYQKIKRDLKLLSLRHSKNIHQNQLQKKSLFDKQTLRIKLDQVLKKQKNWKLSKVNEIIQSSNRIYQRKNQFLRNKQSKSHFNHQAKINEQRKLIDQFEKKISDVFQENPRIFSNEINPQYLDEKVFQIKLGRKAKINRGTEFLLSERKRY